ALVGHQLSCPEEPHDLELLLDALAAIAKALAERLELHGVPADADAEAEPPAGEDVDLRRLLGDERGLALGQDDDASDELDAPGDRGAETEQNERLVERVLVGELAVPASRPIGIGADDAVEGEDVGVAHGLDGLRVVADHRRILPDL